MFLVLPLAGLFLYLFCVGEGVVQEPIDGRAAVLGVAETPGSESGASTQPRVVVPHSDEVPVVTESPRVWWRL